MTSEPLATTSLPIDAPIPRRRRLFVMVAILAATFALRFASIFLATPGNALGKLDDDGDHLRHAQILYTEGYYASAPLGSPDVLRAWRAPLFSVFTFLVFKAHGYNNFLALRIYLCFLSLLVPFAADRLARRFWNPNVGLLAFAWAAFHPAFVHYAVFVQADSFFVAVAAWAFVAMFSQTSAARSLRAGAATGFASLARFHFFPGAVTAGFAAAWLTPGGRRRTLKAIAFLAGVLLLVSPWWIRNYRIFGRFVPFSTEGGFTFWVGNNDMTDGGGVVYVSHPPPGLNELERDKWHYREGVAYMKTHPRRTLELAGAKLARFWGIVPRVGSWKLKLVAFLSYVPLFSLTLFALYRERRRVRDFLPFLILCAYYTAAHSVFPAVMRYRLPLEVIMIAIAAGPLYDLVLRRRGASRPFDAGPDASRASGLPTA